MITGIHHVQIAGPPGCEAEARRFYGGLLGLGEVEKPESVRASGGVWFVCGAQELHVGIEQEFLPARKAHPALVTDDLIGVRRRLEQAGAPISEAPVLERERFFVSDPFGNRLEISDPSS